MKLAKAALAFGWVLAMSMGTPALGQEFPPAGQDQIPGTGLITIQMLPEYGGQTYYGSLVGLTVVNRGDPYPYDNLMGGQQAIDTEIVAMDLVGRVGQWPGELHLQISAPESRGMIIDANPDPAISFPAESFFDIFFEVTIFDTPMGDLSLHNVDPLRMKSMIINIPPDLAETPFDAVGWIPNELYTPRDPHAPLQDLPLVLHAPDDSPVAELLYAKHPPEPGALAILAIGSAVLLRRRRRR